MTQKIRLLFPDEKYASQAIEIGMEFEKFPNRFDINQARKMAEAASQNFEGYFDYVLQRTLPEQPNGRVPATVLWIMNDEELVGVADIRHYLNDYLRNVAGGHIAYEIAPSKRRRGLMKPVLRLLLDYARENFGIEKALITCDEENIISYKIMQYGVAAWGGNEDLPSNCDNHKEFRVWVNTNEGK